MGCGSSRMIYVPEEPYADSRGIRTSGMASISYPVLCSIVGGRSVLSDSDSEAAR